MSDIVIKADDYIKPVRDRIRDTFASMIPDEQWENLCKAEMTAFFNTKAKQFGGQESSPFTQIVQEILKEKSKEFIKEFLNDPKYSISEMWEQNNITGEGGNTIKLSEYLDGMVMKAMPDIMTAMFKNIVAGGIYQMFQQMRASGNFN